MYRPGGSVCRERKMVCPAFEKLPRACAQGVGVTMSYADDADDRLTYACKSLAES